MAKSCLNAATLFVSLLGILVGEENHQIPVDEVSRALSFSRSAIRNDVRPNPNDNNRSLLFVSTLDGRVSALDGKSGKLVWSVMTSPGSMFLSSISKIETSKKGRWFVVVPSLDGGLFKFDGEKVESLPVTTNNLLTKSFQLGDDVVMAGAVDSRFYGVDPLTGKVLYSWDASGRKSCSDTTNQNDMKILLRRQTHVVRGVDPKTGLEKWNYSVGRHELVLVEGSSSLCNPPKGGVDDEDVDASFDNTTYDGHREELDIEIVSSEGSVRAISQTIPAKDVWSYKFGSPVLDAWTLQDGRLKQINLFEVQVDGEASSEVAPLLYLGVHQKQLYIKQSPATLSQTAGEISFEVPGDTTLVRINWKPYVATASSRTPFIAAKDSAVGLLDFIRPPKREDKSTALVIKTDGDYPFDGGYYLFPEETPIETPIIPNGTEIEAEETEKTLDQIIIVSLWYWWKELLGIFLFTVAINIFLTRHYLKWKTASPTQTVALECPIVIYEKSESIVPETPPPIELQQQQTTVSSEYGSRYLTDYEPIQCLGRGGFGVVFHAKHRLDEWNYAIKRICLPSGKEAREKALREVKALVQLHHLGIVHYYDAWLESPPDGWQEQQDKLWEEKGLMTPVSFVSSEDTTEVSKRKSSQIIPFNNSLLNDKNYNNNNEFSTSSLGFIPMVNDGESGSFSLDKWDQSNNSWNISVNHSKRGWGDGESVNSEIELSSFGRVPFQNYQKSLDKSSGDSFIVFEDSGCDDNLRAGESENVVKDSSDGCSTPKTSSRRTRPTSFGEKGLENRVPKTYLYIKMELCKENLKDWLTANATHREKTCVFDIFDQIVSAVEYIHEKDLMHRDLKPSNIFMSLNGTIKIGDFGLVTNFGEDSDKHTPSDTVDSKMHTNQVGTHLYMSPEQLCGQRYSHKVDIFSLGLILFELLIPFGTEMERLKVMMEARKHVFPKHFEANNEECSFVKEMLHHNPEERPTASDIKQHPVLVTVIPPESGRRERTRTLSYSQ